MSSCDRTAPTTWDSGYELDISWADDGIHGHLHFPVKPQVSPARDLTFVVGEWHTVRVEARGSVIAVTLDDKVPLPERDPHSRDGRSVDSQIPPGPYHEHRGTKTFT